MRCASEGDAVRSYATDVADVSEADDSARASRFAAWEKRRATAVWRRHTFPLGEKPFRWL